jgi:hypothetical protein
VRSVSWARSDCTFFSLLFFFLFGHTATTGTIASLNVINLTTSFLRDCIIQMCKYLPNSAFGVRFSRDIIPKVSLSLTTGQLLASATRGGASAARPPQLNHMHYAYRYNTCMQAQQHQPWVLFCDLLDLSLSLWAADRKSCRPAIESKISGWTKLAPVAVTNSVNPRRGVRANHTTKPDSRDSVPPHMPATMNREIPGFYYGQSTPFPSFPTGI